MEPITSVDGGVPPLGKHLASSDKKTRDRAMKSLTAFLSAESHQTLPPADMAKLWKGIFYCYWMSDKPLIQQALATDLANIIIAIPSVEASLAFLRGFWEAMVREWAGIDRLRLDKFYMLVRRYVNASFRLLLSTGWNESALVTYNEILAGPNGPLFPNDSKIPSSLSYHLSDVYLEELNKVLSTDEHSLMPAPILKVLEPFFTLLAQTSNNVGYTRIQDAFFQPLLDSLRHANTEKRPAKRARIEPETKNALEIKEEPFPLFSITQNSIIASTIAENDQLTPSLPRDVEKAVRAMLFTTAGQKSTRDANRRKMYKLWRTGEQDDERYE